METTLSNRETNLNSRVLHSASYQIHSSSKCIHSNNKIIPMSCLINSIILRTSSTISTKNFEIVIKTQRKNTDDLNSIKTCQNKWINEDISNRSFKIFLKSTHLIVLSELSFYLHSTFTQFRQNRSNFSLHVCIQCIFSFLSTS